MDRRRRAILDTVAIDAEYAIEDVRAKRRARARNTADGRDEDFNSTTYRDPGYSQAVRRTCQQRMVQLIPVRRGTLTLVLSCMWILWGGLVFAHYWLHVQPSPAVATAASNAANNLARSSLDDSSEVVFASANSNGAPEPVSQQPVSQQPVSQQAVSQRATPVAQLPITQLFNLRSTHSIGHWLTCQLWMLTALAAWMIFQLRRHKLDDYRARYRIWIVLAIAALFSSFDASSSFLGLLGMSIDNWTRREIGYGGWPLVLATFASLIGVMGIRLCNELRSAPGSVACWMIGLVAWATSALLGTGLIKTSIDPTTIDLIVGGCWLGGILCVFQSAGIYLRQTYVHAQKRFLERSGSSLQPIKFSAPKLSLPFRKKNRDAEGEPTKTKGTLFGFARNRQEQKERLKDEPIREEIGPASENGLTKKRGWFGIGGNRDAESAAPKPVKQRAEKPTSKSEEKRSVEKQTDSTSAPRQGLWSKMHGQKSIDTRDELDSSKATNEPATTKRGWLPQIGRRKASESVSDTDPLSKAPVKNEALKNEAVKNLDEKKAKEPKAPSEKSSWFGFGTGSKASTVNAAASNVKSKVEPKLKVDSRSDSRSDAKSVAGDDKPAKRGIFGMFDGLKLRPPSDNASDPSKQAKPDNRATVSKPIAVQPGQALPSTRDDDDDEDDDSGNGRPLSKAERKRMRRGQDDRRAA
jgi:hypothetical protein